MKTNSRLVTGGKIEYTGNGDVETVNKSENPGCLSQAYHSFISIRCIELGNFSTILRPYYYYY